jgi:hypothetical protein
VTGDGPHRETSTDELVDHGSADRSETGDDVEIRLWHGGLVLSGVDVNNVHMKYARLKLTLST